MNEWTARRNSQLQVRQLHRGQYRDGATLVYWAGNSTAWHADRRCPELAEVQEARSIPLDHVLTTKTLPRQPCSRCSQDLETSIDVAVRFDGLDPDDVALPVEIAGDPGPA